MKVEPLDNQDKADVKVWRESVELPTYDVAPGDVNPMFLERRVYQGSSGKVYPLPFHQRISETPTPRKWDAIYIENSFLRVMILPQLGGRIHAALDKTNGYDFIYRQDVIKPALVGLAGPWISGGIEFNWPQHHRPATYMPVDFHIEAHADGSQTVWLSDHDPMTRMKGMHGVCLHPDRASIEVKVRLYNRTPITQTFLWWANVATRVHESYQSFFPTDVAYVADHARRAMSRFPKCDDHYYGVAYGDRARDGVPDGETPAKYRPPAGAYAANDLSWYANIPVPTSYMCTSSRDDFFGGYDHAAKAGIVISANHHISPGKKQWTWGNHEFGYAWDRNLTDADVTGEVAPYIELMSGVYTDNQPDFSYLAPGETKSFSQYFYPIQGIGPAKKATPDGAIAMTLAGGVARIGVCVTEPRKDLQILVSTAAGTIICQRKVDIAPGRPFTEDFPVPAGMHECDLMVRVTNRADRVLLTYQPQLPAALSPPEPATEIPLPTEIGSMDELYLSGVHLTQYRHATRSPEPYWREALKRDPGDSRCNAALGIWHFRRGEFEAAESKLRVSVRRLMHRNANSPDGEPLYYLGLTLRELGRDDDAYDALYKSTWNAAWRAPAFFALAQIDGRRENWATSLQHLDQVLRVEAEHLQARNLKAIALRKLGRRGDADELLRQTLLLDPLDWAAIHLSGKPLECDTQTRLDLSLEFFRAGCHDDALDVLSTATQRPSAGTAPLVHYYTGYSLEQSGNKAAAHAYRAGRDAGTDYCFPARLEEIAILRAAMNADPSDAKAPCYLGNLFYDKLRHEEAINCWERSVAIDPSFGVAWRNLGIAYFNVLGDSKRAEDAYARAVQASPADTRLVYEQDQLAKRLGSKPTGRLARLRGRMEMVRERDDLSIELCDLYNLTGDHDAARALLESRRFQPWEGGEGMALRQHVRTHLALGRRQLINNPDEALRLFEVALSSPAGLGEAKHLLANQSDIHYWCGVAANAAGREDRARQYWQKSAGARGDFVGMAVQIFSEMTYFTILSLRRLGRNDEADELTAGLETYARELLTKPATIDYFATSLPTMLIFNDDLQKRQEMLAKLLLAQTCVASGEVDEARGLLQLLLAKDPTNEHAADLMESLGQRNS